MPGVGHLPQADRRFGVYLGLFLSIWTAHVLFALELHHRPQCQ